MAGTQTGEAIEQIRDIYPSHSKPAVLTNRRNSPRTTAASNLSTVPEHAMVLRGQHKVGISVRNKMAETQIPEATEQINVKLVVPTNHENSPRTTTISSTPPDHTLLARGHHSAVITVRNTMTGKQIPEATEQISDICTSPSKFAVPTNRGNSPGKLAQHRIRNLAHSKRDDMVFNFVVAKVTEKTPTGTTIKTSSTTSPSTVAQKQSNSDETKYKIDPKRQKIAAVKHNHNRSDERSSDHVAYANECFTPCPMITSVNTRTNDTCPIDQSMMNISPSEGSQSPVQNASRTRDVKWRLDAIEPSDRTPNRRRHVPVALTRYATLYDLKRFKKRAMVIRPHLSITVRSITTRIPATSAGGTPIVSTTTDSSADDKAKLRLLSEVIGPVTKRRRSSDNANNSPTDTAKISRRRFSEYAGSKAQKSLMGVRLSENHDYLKLFERSRRVVNTMRDPFMLRKKGRPKKTQYKNKTHELLCSDDFSTIADRRRINKGYYGCELSESMNKPSTSTPRSYERRKLCAYLSIEPVIEQPSTANNPSQSIPNDDIQMLPELEVLNMHDSQPYASDDRIIPAEDENEYGVVEYLEDEFSEPESPAFEPIVRNRTSNGESVKSESYKSVCDLNGITNAESFLVNTDFDQLRSHQLTTALVDFSFFNLHGDTIDQSLFDGADVQALLNSSPQHEAGGSRMASDARNANR